MYLIQTGPGSRVSSPVYGMSGLNKKELSHNERFYEEYEYERRVRKRRAKLITATEEAFAHIKRMSSDQMKGQCSHYFLILLSPVMTKPIKTISLLPQPIYQCRPVSQHLAGLHYIHCDCSPHITAQLKASFPSAAASNSVWEIIR